MRTGRNNPAFDLSEETMNSQSKLFSRLGGLGIVCSALFVAATVLTGNQPGAGATSAAVIGFYHSHRVAQTAAVFVTMFLAVAFAFFLSSLRRTLSRGNDGYYLAAIVTMGGAVYTSGLLLMGVLGIALIDVADKKVSAAAQTLNVLSSDAWVPVVTGLSMVALATGIAALRSQALPRWLAWASIGLGILAVAGPLGGLAFLVTPAWTLVTGVVLLRSRAGDPRTQQTPSSPARERSDRPESSATATVR
jgi:hypothetical protein